MTAASNSEARKRAAERAAVESTLAVSSPGQCCDGWCVDDIGLHHVDRQTAQDVAESSGLFFAARIEQARAEGAAEVVALHRDLVSRLGFGNNITEPMADNDTIVAWFEQQSRDASEWHESQLWWNDCYEKGHSELDDCYECDPSLRLEAAEAAVLRVEALLGQASARGVASGPPLTDTALRAALRGDA